MGRGMVLVIGDRGQAHVCALDVSAGYIKAVQAGRKDEAAGQRPKSVCFSVKEFDK